jgi:PBP1b-binding outer membrane lipoprotein LpoB
MLRTFIISVLTLFLLLSSCEKKEVAEDNIQEESISDTTATDTTDFEEEDWE